MILNISSESSHFVSQALSWTGHFRSPHLLSLCRSQKHRSLLISEAKCTLEIRMITENLIKGWQSDSTACLLVYARSKQVQKAHGASRRWLQVLWDGSCDGNEALGGLAFHWLRWLYNRVWDRLLPNTATGKAQSVQPSLKEQWHSDKEPAGAASWDTLGGGRLLLKLRNTHFSKKKRLNVSQMGQWRRSVMR